MASLISKIWSRLCPKRSNLSIMLVGLDNSGKTCVLNHLSASTCGGSARMGGRQAASGTGNTSRKHESQVSQTVTESGAGNNKNINSDLLSASTSNNKWSPSQTRNNHDLVDNVTQPTVGYNYERVQFKNISLTVLDFSGQSRYRNLWQEFCNCIDAIVFVIDSSDLIRFVVARDELETLLSHPYFGTLKPPATGAPTDNTGARQQQQQVQHAIGQLAGRAAGSMCSSLIVQHQITVQQGKLVQSPLNNGEAAGDANGRAADDASAQNSANNARYKVPILFLAHKSDLANSVDKEVIVKALNLGQLPAGRHPWHIHATSLQSGRSIDEAFEWLIGQTMTS